MNLINEMAELAKTRPAQLKAKKEQGQKLVGYTGRFVPEELIRAAGAVPFYLFRGGEPEPPEAVLPYMLRFMDPFSRAQIGYHLLGLDPVMNMLDVIVAQCEDCHMTRLADMLEHFELPALRLGVPPDWTKSIARKYYSSRLQMFKERLEDLTGVKITDDKLKESIELMNKIRDLFQRINEIRKEKPGVISGFDAIRIQHMSFNIDTPDLIPYLEKIINALETASTSDNKPKILMVGNVIAMGDYAIPQLIEESGSVIVAEFMDRGHRYAGWNIDSSGDLMENLTNTYYLERVPPSIFQPGWEERFDHIKKLIADYQVDGVIWYQLAFNEIHNLECSVVSKEMDAIGMPFLKLESAYENSREAMGPLTTRIESFIASIGNQGA